MARDSHFLSCSCAMCYSKCIHESCAVLACRLNRQRRLREEQKEITKAQEKLRKLRENKDKLQKASQAQTKDTKLQARQVKEKLAKLEQVRARTCVLCICFEAFTPIFNKVLVCIPFKSRLPDGWLDGAVDGAVVGAGGGTAVIAGRRGARTVRRGDGTA